MLFMKFMQQFWILWSKTRQKVWKGTTASQKYQEGSQLKLNLTNPQCDIAVGNIFFTNLNVLVVNPITPHTFYHLDLISDSISIHPPGQILNPIRQENLDCNPSMGDVFDTSSWPKLGFKDLGFCQPRRGRKNQIKSIPCHHPISSFYPASLMVEDAI